MSDEAAAGRSADQPADSPYVESTIIMTTVRLIAPFVFTYGLFVMFHGADSPGGGFQGGVIVGAVVVMIGFAFGVEPTRDWVRNELLVGLAAAGALAFVGVGLGAQVLDGRFLQYGRFDPYIYHASRYLIELVELGIGAIVAAVVMGLFFSLAAGYDREERTRAESAAESADGGDA